MISVNNLIISIAAMFCSIGIVTFIILVYFCIYYIVERIRKKRKRKQVCYYTKYRQYPSVECCCKDCMFFMNTTEGTNVSSDGNDIGICRLRNRPMYTDSFCFSAKKRGDVE